MYTTPFQAVELEKTEGMMYKCAMGPPSGEFSGGSGLTEIGRIFQSTFAIFGIFKKKCPRMFLSLKYVELGIF